MRERAFIEIESICKYFLILNPPMKGLARTGKFKALNIWEAQNEELKLMDTLYLELSGLTDPLKS